MLRIEVYQEKGALFEIKTLPHRYVKIGRGKFSDILLTDPRVSRDEMMFEKQNDGTYSLHHKGQIRHFNQYLEIDLFDYKIKATALDQISDDITKDLPDLRRAGEVRNTQLLVWFAVFIGLNTFEYLVYENWSKDGLKVTIDLFSSFIILVPFTLLMSLVARAVEGTYHFKKILLLSLQGAIGIFLVVNNLFGLRWFLGAWLWREQIYLFFLVGVVTYFLWHLGVVVFSHINEKIRLLILTLLVLIYIVPQFVKYLPYRNTYQYLTLHAPPPLIKVFETKSVSHEEFIQKINSL